MTLIKWKNSPETTRLNRFTSLPLAFPELFDNMIDANLFNRSLDTTLPAVNVAESNDGFQIEMAAPGFNKSDFKVEVDNMVLTISAESKAEQTDENENNGLRYARREFSYQSFSRSFTLPETVNTDQINATYEQGLLMLNIPKKEEAKPQPARAITIS